jgi:hypothetical protein
MKGIHEALLLTCMKLANNKHGFIINFNAKLLVSIQYIMKTCLVPGIYSRRRRESVHVGFLLPSMAIETSSTNT